MIYCRRVYCPRREISGLSRCIGVYTVVRLIYDIKRKHNNKEKEKEIDEHFIIKKFI
jgi:hypothetical protein